MKKTKKRLGFGTIPFLLISIFLLANTVFAQQKSDASYDVTVDEPAYEKGKGPVVLFDEGHNNFHTSTGRYKPFADVIRNDGYIIVINQSKFTEDILKNHSILVISNALEQRDCSFCRTKI